MEIEKEILLRYGDIGVTYHNLEDDVLIMTNGGWICINVDELYGFYQMIEKIVDEI